MFDRIMQGLGNLEPGDYTFVFFLAIFFFALLVSRKR